MHTITPFLWFDGMAEAAAEYYVSIFPNSRILQIMRHGEAGREQHGQAPGSVMTVAFELDGQHFTAINGGPQFKFSRAVSFVVHCKSQAEVDHYWDRLGAGGPAEAQQCGWLTDRYGLSWQIVPDRLIELLAGPATGRVMEAMMQMKKLDIVVLERAAENGG